MNETNSTPSRPTQPNMGVAVLKKKKRNPSEICGKEVKRRLFAGNTKENNKPYSVLPPTPPPPSPNNIRDLDKKFVRHEKKKSGRSTNRPLTSKELLRRL